LDKDNMKNRRSQEAYLNETFLGSSGARPLRILAEYLEPDGRFRHYKVEDTIVFMGSARLLSRSDAEAKLAHARDNGGDVEAAERELEMSRYYEAARELAYRFTEWSKQLGEEARRFVVCTGGGPGIMEAANRGASEARGMNIGLTISIPIEEFDNQYVTRELSFHFHYFFMRKFWFAYLAKAVLVFPGGFGTLDELFELLTLRQTKKMSKHLPIVLFGTSFWREVINFDALIRSRTISPGDMDLMFFTDSVDEAYEYIVQQLEQYAQSERGPRL
jgi:uncharacterized protein (TIGR00730 family)